MPDVNTAHHRGVIGAVVPAASGPYVGRYDPWQAALGRLSEEDRQKVQALVDSERKKQIGARIKQLRENSPYTQQALAELVGVQLRGYQKWEQTGGVSWDNLKKLAEVHGVELDWILWGERKPTPDLNAAFGNKDLEQLRQEVTALRRDVKLLLALARRQDPEEYSEAQQAAAEAIQDLADAFEDAPAERRKAS